MEIGGAYPMLYAFFDGQGALCRESFIRQIEAAVAAGAAGIAVLGLGTEVAKLGRDERHAVLSWTAAALAGRLPLAVTVAEGALPDAIDFALFAQAAGADWLILQPPRPPIAPDDLIRFFGSVADRVDCPVAVQNAPEFLGVGLTPAELAALNAAHPNVSVVKAECSAAAIAGLIAALGPRMRVFNGRAGLELPDNVRAGAHGMIPGLETIDFQVRIMTAMRAGDVVEAEALYRKILPTLAFAMQGLGAFTLYGKRIAARRLGLAPSADRAPADRPTSSGLDWADRYAAELGPLPG
jgi:4-hydroxy-tetrahydrodipicolinate synthase